MPTLDDRWQSIDAQMNALNGTSPSAETLSTLFVEVRAYDGAMRAEFDDLSHPNQLALLNRNSARLFKIYNFLRLNAGFYSGDVVAFLEGVEGDIDTLFQMAIEQAIEGPQGEVGAIGPQGDQGVQGTNAEIYVSETPPATPFFGFWLDSSNGKYFGWFTDGDSAQWVEVGANGINGSQGDQGAAGPQGEVGAAGPQGDQGEVGAAGPQGEVGAAGPQGDQGGVGAAGPQGVPGDSSAAAAIAIIFS